MKSSPNKVNAGLALIGAGIIGGFMPILSKVVLREVSPLTLLFVSLTIMVIVLVPISWRDFVTFWEQKKKLFWFGLLWMANITLFIIGLNYTTAVASQVLYAGVPILVFILHYLLTREKVSISQIVGILLGLAGVLTFVLGSIQGTEDFGSFVGNIIIFIATLSWAIYLINSKKLSQNIHPLVLTTGSAVIAWFGSGLLMLFQEGTTGLFRLGTLSLSGWLGLLFIGLMVRVAMILLFNWGIKHGSSIVAGTMTYLSLLTTTILSTLILGEQLTVRFFIGTLLVLVGVFLTSTLPLIQKYRA